jgi:protein required for attachment to host cells
MITWVLVADGSRARLFSASKYRAPWILLGKFDHAESRAKTIELDPTERGRSKPTLGAGHGPAMEPKTPPRQVEQIHFAHQLKDRLASGLRRGAYTELVLVAPPRFLGRLKARLDPEVAKSLVHVVDKDYTKCGVAELRQRLGELVEVEQENESVDEKRGRESRTEEVER